MWNPPLIDEALGARRSPLGEAAELLAALVREGARTICFMKSRRAVELHRPRRRATALREAGEPELAERVAPYRAGYTPAAAPRARAPPGRGELLGVVATDALELGIDIGALDAAIVRHVPRHGRVAAPDVGPRRAARHAAWPSTSPARTRSTSSSAATPTSSSTGPSRRRSSTTSPSRSTCQHLLCAAHEGPLERGRRRVPRARAGAATPSGSSAPASCRASAAARFVLRQPEDYPAARVSLRSASPRRVRDRRRRVGRADRHGRGRARVLDRPRGRDLPAPRPLLRGRGARPRAAAARSCARSTGDWYTQPKRETDTEIERLLDRREALGVTLSFGERGGDREVLAYQRKRLADHEVLDLIALDLPPTHASPPRRCGTSCPTSSLARTSRSTRCSARCTPPSTRRSRCCRCSRCATAGTSAACRPTSTRRPGAPTIFIYDGHPGGDRHHAPRLRASSRSSCATPTA